MARGDLLDRNGAISLPRPAWRWWEDIVFTGSRILLFQSEEAAGTWAPSAGEPLAATMTLAQSWRLSETWYAGRLARDYERPPREHFRRLLAAAGLVGNAWSLTMSEGDTRGRGRTA